MLDTEIESFLSEQIEAFPLSNFEPRALAQVGSRTVRVGMRSHEIKKFQMKRQVWERNWTSRVSLGTGYGNNKKNPEGSGGQGGPAAFYFEVLEKTSCLGTCNFSSAEPLRGLGHLLYFIPDRYSLKCLVN